MIHRNLITIFCDTYQSQFVTKTKWNRKDATSRFYIAWKQYFSSGNNAYFVYFVRAKELFLQALQTKNDWGRDELRTLLETILRTV